MRLVTIGELPTLENKEGVPSIQGTLTKVYERKTGESDRGPWSVQNGLLQDSTGEIKVLFTNQPDARIYQGKSVSITSHVGDKGMSGVYAHDDTYQGNVKRILKLTATAQIAFVDGASGAETAAKAALSTMPPETVVQHINAALGRIRNAFYLIELSVKEECTAAEKAGIPFDSDNFGGKCSSAHRLLDPLLLQALPEAPIWEIEGVKW